MLMSSVAQVHDVQQVEEAQAVAVTPQLAPVPARQQATAAEFDPHPLVTVFVAMMLAFAGAATFIGAIVACLALRHSGVMAP
jgi:hypothetical protein